MRNILYQESIVQFKHLFHIMKITALALFIFAGTAFATDSYSQVKKVTIVSDNISMGKVINEIEKQTGYLFVFNVNEVNLKRNVQVNAKNKSTAEVLAKVFEGTDISYAMEGRNIMLMSKEKEAQPVKQDNKLRGTVRDGRGEPVIGANLSIKGHSGGTITDMDGRFSINAPADAVLQVSYIGFLPQEVSVGNKTTLTIVLKEDNKALDEVIVVGYGVQKKKLVTGATVQVKGEDISKLNTVSPLGALQSQAPGVSIVKNNGKPGEGFKVTVRGLGTIGNADPLYIIDGMVGGDMNLLNPSDIESVDVLKDAASTAIYGARAANGVILVTTKKGKKGKPSITLDAYYGWQNIYKKPQLLDAKQYATIINEGRLNDGLIPWDFASIVEDWDKIESGAWKGTNWLNEMVGKDKPQQNYALGISGGTEQSVYSIGLGYTSQEGIIGSNYINSKYERYNGRINTEYTLAKNDKFDILKIGENLTFSYTNRNGLDIAADGVYYNDLHNALTAFPFMPVYDKDGKFQKTIPWSSNEVNPVAYMYYERGNNVSQNFDLRTNYFITVQPIEKLIWKTSFGVNYSGNSYRSFIPSYNLGGIYYRPEGQDLTSQSSGNGYSWAFDSTVSYDFSLFDKHHIGVMGGTSAEKWGMGQGMGGSNIGSEFDDFNHAYLSNNKTIYADKTSVYGYPWGSGALMSYFGRLNYDYNDTYMATLILRADGSSNFAPGHRWGTFPSASVGWNITNESWMESTKSWLDFLKIRGSWGRNGNANIDNFQYLSTISLSGADYYFGTDKISKNIGAYPDVLANPDVTWEKSEQIDLGFDARSLNGRLGLNFDWYNKMTKDWLVRAPVLSTYGAGAPYINGGDVRNRGFEMALSWNDHIRDFNYGANINVTHNSNKVTRIANSEGIINGPTEVLSSQTQEMYRAQVGYPIGYFYGYKTDGIFQNEEEVATYVDKNGKKIMPNAQPGDVKFVDMNGDATITTDDRTMIGNPNPDYTMGLSLTASYKGLDISITGNGTFGNQIAKSYRSFADRTNQNYTMDVAQNRWHGEGTSNRYPRITSQPHINWSYISDIYIEDGDYFRISNLTMGYDFMKMFKKLPFQQLRVYASVQNLYAFTNYSGMDPEIGFGGGSSWASGIDLGYYPGARTFIIGTNIKF